MGEKGDEIEGFSKGEKTRRRILDAAAKCIAEKGIESASITEIAKRAKVSRGLVAHYIPKKADLFLEVIRWIIKEAIPKIAPPDDLKTAEEKIIYRIRMNFEFFMSRPDLYRCIMLFYYFSGIRKDFKALNTELAIGALERMLIHVREYADETKLNASEEKLKALVQSLVWESMGAMQTFFFVEHKTEFSTFIAAHLKSARALLSAAHHSDF